jgi:maleate isomerase
MTAGMYGWRGRVGLILPADNVLMEPELNELAIPGVSFHGLRLTATEPAEMRAQAVELARSVTELGLDAVVYACAETSFNGGDGVRSSLSRMIEAECGRPVITATNAALEALDHLGITRVALVTPYSPASAEILERTLRENDVEVVSAVHRDFSLETDDPRVWFLTNRQHASEVYQMARSLDRSSADAVLIVSTNFPTLAILEQLEQDTGLPVISSNQSLLWWSLRTLGLGTAGVPLGALFRASAPGRSAAPEVGS